MIDRPTPGEQVAGIAGLALLLTMFLFAWYGFGVEGGGSVPGLDAFDAFGDWFNIILVLAAFSGMALALVGSGVARLPISLSVVTTVLAGVGAVILLIYVISPPSADFLDESIDLDRKLGVFLGLVELIALSIGGYMAMQEEGASFGSTADHLADPSAHQPQPPQHQQPPPPPPAPQDYQQPPAQPPPPPAPPQEYQPPPQQQQSPPPPPPPPAS
ncbi:MAG TPA: hypothetical protein VIT85_03050 [Solirubrobacterales bacterium]